MKIKTLVGISLAVTLLMPAFSFAQTTSVGDLQAQIQALLVQIQALQAQMKAQGGQPAAFCHTFSSNLRYGDSGAEVLALQSVLTKEGFTIASQESEIAGGAAQFGESTAAAVTGFQQKYSDQILTPAGLKYGTGFAGAGTRAKLNKLYGCGGTTPPTPVPPPVPCTDVTGTTCPYVEGRGWYPTTTPPVLPPATNAPKITRISAPASEDYELSPGGRFAISGSNLTGSGNDTAKVYVEDKLATITQSSNELIWAIAPVILEKNVVIVRVINSNGSSNLVRATVLGSTGTTGGPTISGVSGPTTLNVGQQGTWTVKTADQGNGTLSYSVIWGDEGYQSAVPQANGSAASIQQTATFTHTYNTANTYSPRFTVTNSNGGSAQTSLSVNVGTTAITIPQIYSLYPTSGPVGTTVYINGSGFTPTNNTVNFGYGVITGLPATAWISDSFTAGTTGTGMTIAFQVPSSMSPACANTTPRCMIAAMLTTPGPYKVWVTNANGTSATAPIFTVTGNTTPPPTTFSSFSANPVTIASGQTTTISFYGTNLSTVTVNVSCPSGVSSPDGHGGNFCGQTPTFASGVNSTQLQFNNSATNNQQVTITASAYDANGSLVGTKSAYVTVTGVQTALPSATVNRFQTSGEFIPGALVTVGWTASGSGYDKYQMVVGNSLMGIEKQLYDRVSMIDYLPTSQMAFNWNLPDLLNDFAKGSGYSFDQIKNYFYFQLKLIKNDVAGGGIVATSNKFPFFMVSTVSPTVSVLSPNGGEIFSSEKGGFTARWEATNGQAVNLYLLSGDSQGTVLQTIATNVTGGSYSVNVDPNLLQKDVNTFRLKACLAANTSVCDTSNAPFTFSFQGAIGVPVISSIDPTSGPVGTTVYINGSGFTPTNNTVNFGYGAIPGLTSATWVADPSGTSGQTINFMVPSFLSPACAFTTPRCMIAAMLTTPGPYKVWVTNANGTSATAPIFTVTANSAPYTPPSTPPTSLNSQANQTANVLSLWTQACLKFGFDKTYGFSCY